MPDVLDFDGAARRIARSMLVIGIAGTAAAFVRGGWKWGVGFLLGALLSGVNFYWLRRLVEIIGERQGRRRLPGVRAAVRSLLIAAAAYAIVRCSSITPPAVIAGLFVLTAAVFVETIFEIVYARK
jgi:hypothetical protein